MSTVNADFSYIKNAKNEDHIIAILIKLEDYVSNVSLYV